MKADRRGSPATAALSPLLLYPLVAAAVLWPFAGPDLKVAGDLHSVVAGVAEARNALAEGQFPVRVAPRQWGGAGYPFFQYYGNFPYTLAGALDLLPGINPYTAWKIVTFGALVLSGVFTYRCALRFTGRRGRGGAVVAGAAFIAAPYMLTDVFARGLFGEVVAFCLLPVLLYTAVRAFRRPGIRYVVATAVVWAIVGHTHNITYLYASSFLAIFFLTFARPSKKYVRRGLRLAAAAAIQGALVAWYFVPQVATLDRLNIRNAGASPFDSLGRAPLSVLLAPTMTPPPAVPGSAFGIQIGWPILAGVVAAVIGVVWRCRRNALLRGMTWRFTLLFGIATFMAWSPFDFWRRLPESFCYVQFPYRLLMFCVLWGTLLVAIAIRCLAPAGLRCWHAAVLLALIGLGAYTYRPGRLAGDPQGAERATTDPQLSGLLDYRLVESEVGDAAVSDVRPQRSAGGARQRFRVSTPQAARVRLPVFYYPSLLRVRVDKRAVAYEDARGFVAVDVPAGQHRIDVRFAGVGWANAISLTAWIGAGGIACAQFFRRSQAPRRRIVSPRGILVTLAAFAAFFGGLRANALYKAARAVVDPPVTLTVTASPPSQPQYEPQNAFDGDRLTEWAATGNDPITLTVAIPRAMVLERVELEPRGIGLHEGWQHVRVELFREGMKVDAADIEMHDAWRERVVTVTPPATPADRVEFHFSSPVTKLLDGHEVGPEAVNPGYREIRLEWAKK